MLDLPEDDPRMILAAKQEQNGMAIKRAGFGSLNLDSDRPEAPITDAQIALETFSPSMSDEVDKATQHTELSVGSSYTGQMLKAGMETSLDLTSRGVACDYPEKKISVRSLNILEVEQLDSSVTGASSFDVPNILAQATSFPDLNVLTRGDFWFVAIWFRINTFPEIPLELDWKCPKCEMKNTSTVKNEMIQIDYLSEDYKKDPATLQLSDGRRINLRLSKIGDDREIADYINKVYQDTPPPGIVASAKTAICIDIPRGNLYEKIQILNSIQNPSDLIMIKEFQKLFHHGVRDYVECSCGGCEVSSKINFPFKLRDLIPTKFNQQNLRKAISFN